jgi:hypothetical protein
LPAGIHAVERSARGHLESLFDPVEPFALGNNAVVQVNGEFTAPLPREKMVERKDALDFDGGDTQGTAAGRYILGSDVTTFVLGLPQDVEKFGAFKAEMRIRMGRPGHLPLVHNDSLSLMQTGSGTRDSAGNLLLEITSRLR